MLSETALAELVCNAKDCPARHMTKVLIYGEDFQFCLHHYNAIEHLLLQIDAELLQVDAFGPEGIEVAYVPSTDTKADEGGVLV